MENKKKKICFIIPSVKSGGIETYLLRFLKYINDEFDCTILVRNNNNGELYEEYKNTGVKLYFQPLGNFNIFKMIWYYRFFKINSFDNVCDFNSNFAGIPMFLAYLAKVKKRLVFYRQGKNHFKPNFIKNNINSWMNWLVFKFSTNILSNSEAAIDYFFHYKEENDNRFMVIYNGVNIKDYQLNETKIELRKKLNLPLNNYIIGHVGRLDSAKNHKTILKVFQKLNLEFNDIHFVLCGRNTEKLQQDIETLGLSDKISLLGFRWEIPNILKTFDAFYFPSITEGQPNALIEAMVSGLPVISSEIKPIKECIPEEKQYCLVPPLEIDIVIKKIVELRKTPEKFIFKDFAIMKFDSEVQFKIFKNVLYEK